jgi:hypothetical protein
MAERAGAGRWTALGIELAAAIPEGFGIAKVAGALGKAGKVRIPSKAVREGVEGLAKGPTPRVAKAKPERILDVPEEKVGVGYAPEEVVYKGKEGSYLVAEYSGEGARLAQARVPAGQQGKGYASELYRKFNEDRLRRGVKTEKITRDVQAEGVSREKVDHLFKKYVTGEPKRPAVYELEMPAEKVPVSPQKVDIRAEGGGLAAGPPRARVGALDIESFKSGDPELDKLMQESMTANWDVNRKAMEWFRRGVGKKVAVRKGEELKVFPDEYRDAIVAAMGDDPKAVKRIANRAAGAAESQEEMLVHAGLLKRLNKDLAEIQTAIRAGDDSPQLHRRFQQAIVRQLYTQGQLQGAVAEWGRAGRAIQAFRDMPMLSPEIADKIFKGTPKGTGDVMLDLVKRVRKGEDIVGIVSKAKKKPGFWDKMFEFTIANMLYNPKTHAVNITSNIGFGGARTVERIQAAGIQKLLNITGLQKAFTKATSNAERVSISEAAGNVWGLLEGYGRVFAAIGKGAARPRKGGKYLKDVFVGEESAYGKFIREQGLDPADFPIVAKYDAPFQKAIPGVKGKVIRTSLNALMLEDDAAKTIGHITERTAKAWAKAAKEVSPLNPKKFQKAVQDHFMDEDVIGKAVQYAEELTFTDTNKFTDWVLKARAVPGARHLIPFARVMSNLSHRTLERAPFIGFGIQVGKAAKGHVSLAEGLARPLLPTIATATVIGAWVEEGTITGGKPMAGSAEYISQQPARAAGWKPYSVKVDNEFITLDRFEPVGKVIGMCADAYIAHKEHKTGIGKPPETLYQSLAHAILRQSLLGGFGEFTEAVVTGKTGRSKLESVGQFGGQFATRFIPAGAAVGEVARRMDPVERETRGFVGQLKRGIPGLRETLPEKKDIFERRMPAKTKLGFGAKFDQAELRTLMKAEELGNIRRTLSPSELKDLPVEDIYQKTVTARKALEKIDRKTTRRMKKKLGKEKRTAETAEAKSFFSVMDKLLKLEYSLAKQREDRRGMGEAKREARRRGFRWAVEPHELDMLENVK